MENFNQLLSRARSKWIWSVKVWVSVRIEKFVVGEVPHQAVKLNRGEEGGIAQIYHGQEEVESQQNALSRCLQIQGFWDDHQN